MTASAADLSPPPVNWRPPRLSPNIARQQGDSLGGQRGCAETPFSCVAVTWGTIEAISRHAILQRNRLNVLSVARLHIQVRR